MLISAITRGERQVMHHTSDRRLHRCAGVQHRHPNFKVTMLLQNLSAGQLHAIFAARPGGKSVM
jgi:hypothetical protein